MPGLLSSPDELRTRRLTALLHLFQKTNRILSGKKVTCSLSRVDDYAPAWTSGIDITFSDKLVGAVETAEDIVRLTGLDLHELGHAMHTPDARKRDSKLATLIMTSDVASRAFNILEDQRQESMVVATWPSTRHYLTAMFVEYIMNNAETNNFGRAKPADHSTTFLLSHGRRYLGSDIRDAIEKLFAAPALIKDFKDVIDRYRVLNLDQFADVEIAYHLVTRFVDLLNKLPQDKTKQALAYEHAEMKQIYGGKQDRKSAGDRAQSQSASEAVQDGKDDRDNMPNGSGDAGSDKDKDDGEPDEGEGSSGEGWREDEKDGKGGRGYTPGNRNRPRRTDGEHGDEDLNDAVKKALDEILQDDEIREEVERHRKAIKRVEAPEQIKKHVTFRFTHDSLIASAARRIGRKLREVVETQDPGWNRRTAAGRLNVGRIAGGDVPLEEMFDLWDEGNTEAASLEGVVILDTSYSMNGQQHNLSKAAWAMKWAFDSIDAPCTVYEFNDYTTVVYEARDKAKAGRFPNIVIQGGTDPHDAVAEAARRLIASKRKKRVCIIMTDGTWGGRTTSTVRHNADEFIAEMNKAGILTVLAYYGYGGETSDGHNCTIKRVIDDLQTLVDMTNQIVRTLVSTRR